MWSKTFPYNNSIVSLFFYRGLFETSDHDITVETSIEQINVGRRNNFHLVIISNGEASRIESFYRGKFLSTHPANTESNFPIYNVPSIHGNDVVSRISDHFRPPSSKITAVPIDFQGGSISRARHQMPPPLESSFLKKIAIKNIETSHRCLSIKLNLPFLDLVPFLSNSRAFRRLHVEA